MANGINKAILIGNLGRDPEMRYTQSGLAVCNFSIATNETWTDKDGEKQERTEWHNVVVWNKPAEACAQYLKAGSQVYVEGRITEREWEDKEGNRRFTTEIVAQQTTFLGGKGGDSSERSNSAGGGTSSQPPAPDTDIPF